MQLRLDMKFSLRQELALVCDTCRQPLEDARPGPKVYAFICTELGMATVPMTFEQFLSLAEGKTLCPHCRQGINPKDKQAHHTALPRVRAGTNQTHGYTIRRSR